MSEVRFHPTHGTNVTLSTSGRIAERLPGYGKGLLFSSRPIKVNEVVSVRLLSLSSQLSSTVCFGFTSRSPSAHRGRLHQSYLDVFKSGCYWIWPLFKHLCHPDTTLSYYLNEDGHVHFGVNGRETDSFYKRVESRGGPLWAVLDVEGEGTSVEISSTWREGAEPNDKEVEAEEDEEEEDEEWEEECTVCCSRQINAVLYKCGHMCMCFECAVQVKEGRGMGQCPICRAEIRDVIRTYK